MNNFTECLRYDRGQIRAKRTDEGYLVDNPVVGRTGILIYHNPDGSLRRELRLAEDVFEEDSLNSFVGKPITDDHTPVPVNAENARQFAVGTIHSAKQDGENVTASITIHDAATIDKVVNGKKRELSLGYKVELEQTPGVWNGQHYDAIQRKIRINHLAIVQRGRAGNAKITLDRYDAISYLDEEPTMADKTAGVIRLDSGLSYNADAEVVVEFEKLRADLSEHQVKLDAVQAKLDAMTAERDALNSEVAKLPQLKLDAIDQAKREVAERAKLEKTADDFKIDHAGKSDKEIKIAVIKSVRADAALDDKSDEYLAAAFDIAVSTKADEAIKSQRLAGHVNNDAQAKPSSKNAYKSFMANLGKPKEAA